MDDYTLSRPWRLFHVAKAVVCILCKREAPAGHETWEFVDNIAQWDFHHAQHCEFGEYLAWQELIVGYGWRNWYYDIQSNSSI